MLQLFKIVVGLNHVNKQNDYLQRRIRKMHMCLYECGIALSIYMIGVWVHILSKSRGPHKNMRSIYKSAS